MSPRTNRLPSGRPFPALIAVLLCALMATATRASAADYDHAGLAREALESHIRPGYARLAEAMRDLAVRVDRLCADPSAQTLGRAQDGFEGAALAWARMEHVRFGPVVEENRYERIAFWPDPKGIGRRQVARAIRKRDSSLLDPASLSQKSVALQGLTALERLLYGKTGERLAKRGEETRFRCGYALTIARNLHTVAGAIEAGWGEDGAFARLWLTPGPDNPVYRTPKEVTLELVKAFNYGLETVRDGKLRGALGLARAGGRASPPQYARSGLSIPAIATGVEGVKALYAKGGLEERLEPVAPRMAKLINLELGEVLTLAEGIKGKGAAAFRNDEDRDKLIAMGYPLKNAVQTGGAALGAAAGLTIGFNAGDGD